MLTLAQEYFGTNHISLTYLDLFIKLVTSSFVIWVTLLILRQIWVKSLAQTLTIFLLPLITSVITNVITGDIALSLGMVGALSIVRFRNPVRSPFELTVYFLLITVGITGTKNGTLLIFLIASFVALSFLYLFVEKISKNGSNRSFFLPSFREGNLLNTVEISSIEELKIENQNLMPTNVNIRDKNFSYIFSSSKSDEIKKIYNTYKNNKNVTAISLNLI